MSASGLGAKLLEVSASHRRSFFARPSADSKPFAWRYILQADFGAPASSADGAGVDNDAAWLQQSRNLPATVGQQSPLNVEHSA
eukprot:CAMPEP_0181413020 /NCGR_PEP_ID=MMETSP1110-20121109/8741_1 /TAXON_ID=174948 /ORGANISM="Symbiodinium sp., Strain CCMP421" /LENGTH=83 /DNA_ID=CAMNT_0023535789 /DNA_START=1577 /DNA_END=1828 /DNA_ORIENTATION=+